MYIDILFQILFIDNRTNPINVSNYSRIDRLDLIIDKFRMPFGNTEINRCPRCNQAVFHAEAIPAAGKQWHKTCYRCGMSSCLLFVMFIDEFRSFRSL